MNKKTRTREDHMGKSPEMKKMLEEMAGKLFGRSRNEDACVTCGSKSVGPFDFNDLLSEREFSISRMCQKCQDSTFSS
jgi:hypothetical protein